jgi:L-alanine-DL-glutamate epimerase-like enolase superfamily enzyme
LHGSDLIIDDVTACKVDIPLKRAFTISRGSMAVAENLYIKVTLHSGIAGYGESAPFSAVTGEDREGTLEAVTRAGQSLIGRSAAGFRHLSRLIAETTENAPAARCGLETAILDAFCRVAGIPMWMYFGAGVTNPQKTAVTIPIVDERAFLELASGWYEAGFRILKIKVGRDCDREIEHIETLTGTFSDVSLILDANQGFGEEEAVGFIKSLERIGAPVRFIEQPVPKDDLEAMARLRRDHPFLICADESIASREDVGEVCKSAAADIINIKIMKSGVAESFDMAILALAGGLNLMFGGMVESRLAMGCSLAMACGVGPVHTLDLDTPLLMAEDPLDGGFRYEGPEMILSYDAGLGITPVCFR